MPELAIATQQDRKQGPSGRGSPPAARQSGSRAKSDAPLQLGTVGPAGLSLAAVLGSILRGVILLPIVLAGIALLLSGLMPGLFIALLILLVGLAPIVVVALGILLTGGIEMPGDSRKCSGDLQG